jgi:hypothetical protein
MTASLTKFGTGTKLRTGHCPEEHQQVTLLQTEEWNPQVMSRMTLLQTEERNVASNDTQSSALPKTPKPHMQQKTEYVGQAK